MAKVQIKSEKTTSFRGIFHIRELFSRFAGPDIDKVLGLRCTSYATIRKDMLANDASTLDEDTAADYIKALKKLFAIQDTKDTRTSRKSAEIFVWIFRATRTNRVEFHYTFHN